MRERRRFNRLERKRERGTYVYTPREELRFFSPRLKSELSHARAGRRMREKKAELRLCTNCFRDSRMRGIQIQ